MIEVEIKLPVRDRRNLQKKLEEDGFVKSHLVRETDWYFDGRCAGADDIHYI